jgi:hypothetical protein
MTEIKATINLRNKLVKIHTTRRLKKAPDYLKERVAKLTGVDISKIKISKEVNDLIMVDISRRMHSADFIIKSENGLVEINVPKKMKQQAAASASDKAKDSKTQLKAADITKQEPKKVVESKTKPAANGSASKETAKQINNPATKTAKATKNTSEQ